MIGVEICLFAIGNADLDWPIVMIIIDYGGFQCIT